MSVSHAQRLSFRASWRRLTVMSADAAAAPAKSAAHLYEYSRNARTSWILPSGVAVDGRACMALAMIVADYAQTPSVRDREAKAKALQVYVDIVAALLDRLDREDPSPPLTPASQAALLRRRRDLDGPDDEEPGHE